MTIENASRHVQFHHQKADGWVTLARKTDGKWRQYHYRPEDVQYKLSEWLGEDVYFSQNTYYRPFRRIENIRQLRAIYVDLDCYLLNFIPEQIIGELENDFFMTKVPEPNLIIYSGMGLNLVWLIDPAPVKALPLWQAIQNYFLKQLKSFGGDQKVSDAARVLRIGGSTNSKNGAEVQVQYRHNDRPTLRDLQSEYLPDLQPYRPVKGRPKRVTQLYNVHSLHFARLRDLTKLIELRNYEVSGYRETICFLYRYWNCCFLQDPDEALDHTLELNQTFSAPLRDEEVIRATKSAEKAYTARNNAQANEVARGKGYPGAGYNVSNRKLVSWLDITEYEQRYLSTIIGTGEKRKRNRVQARAYREKNGALTRDEYIEKEHEKTEDKLWLLKQAMERYPNATQKEYADMLNVSDRYIRKLLGKT